MPRLSGKKALITGALGTIGRSLVTRFGEEGATVIALDRPGAENAEKIVRDLAAGTRYFGCDLNDLAATNTAVSKLADELGGIEILINNAAYVNNRPYDAFSIEEYEEEVRINSSAAFVLTRCVAKQMRERKAGKILNITSLTLNGRWDGFVPYVASKGALYGLVKSFARELGAFNINVNGIGPGAVLSEAEYRHYGDRREQYHNWILENQSIKLRIDPVDIANAAVFLSSEEARMISGQNLFVDGGW